MADSTYNATRHITPPTNCTGCGLCMNVCSRDAIRMEWNKEGFLVPAVEVEKCIGCGACIKSCIAIEDEVPHFDNIEYVQAYAGWNHNQNTHMQSSSGGIFTALAERIISLGGCVFGVVWKDNRTAVFDKAETMDTLTKMRGSKYTQAIPNLVYRQVRSELRKGKLVLFSGTPCQVRALKKYLRKPFENLLTIDIVCHGVPSHLLLEKYVQEAETKLSKKINYISFRDKPEGWLRFHVTCHYVDGSSVSQALDQDIYMRLFLSDIILNHACYKCPYARFPRQGDITLGDYWGVQNFHPNWPMDKGISAILANTIKGEESLKKLTQTLKLHYEPFCNILECQRNGYIRQQKILPPLRHTVLKKIQNWTLEKVYNRLVDTVPCGIFHLSRTSTTYKMIRSSLGVVRKIKRKLLTLICLRTPPHQQVGVAQAADFA